MEAATMGHGGRVILTEEQVRQIEALIAERKHLLFTGMEHLHALKKVLEHAVNHTGVVIEWDPSTPPALRERLTIISLSALQWGIGVAALGMLIGVFTDKPGTWTAAGAGVGAIIGGIKGQQAVRSGWRLRGGRDENGVEYVEVTVTG
jgi:hypothetical protein